MPDRIPPLVKQIMTGLRYRYASLNNTHYEVAWTDGLTVAAGTNTKCSAMPPGAAFLGLPVGMSWPSSVASRDN